MATLWGGHSLHAMSEMDSKRKKKVKVDIQTEELCERISQSSGHWLPERLRQQQSIAKSRRSSSDPPPVTDVTTLLFQRCELTSVLRPLDK